MRGPLGAVASIDSGMLSIANGSMLWSCEYDQQRIKIYVKSLFTYVQYVELRNKPHIIHHAPSKDENTRQVSDYAHQQRNILSHHIFSLSHPLSIAHLSSATCVTPFIP